jgi:thiol:disulfide interchange protein
VTPREALLAAAGLVLLALLVWLARRYLPGLPWARLGAAFATPWRQLRQLRKPALPERLNPGSSAGD